MTPQEIKAAVMALRKEVGPNSYVDGTISSDKYRDEIIMFVLYPDGIGGVSNTRLTTFADTWEEGLEKLRTQWVEYSERHRAERVRKMALEIIRITAEQGACTDAALRAGDFTDEEVNRYSEDAIADANTIASNGPFSVVKLSGANAA